MTTDSKPFQVLIAIDNDLERLGIRSVFCNISDIIIVGEVKTKDETNTSVNELNPDILIIDMNLFGQLDYGTEHWIKRISCKTNVLVLVDRDFDGYLSLAIESGTFGCISKQESIDMLLESVYHTGKGQFFLQEISITERSSGEIILVLELPP